MKNTTLDAEQAAAILFGWKLDEPDFDPTQDQFSSGADVCEALASYFGFTAEDYLRIAAARRKRQAADD